MKQQQQRQTFRRKKNDLLVDQLNVQSLFLLILSVGLFFYEFQ